MQVMRLTVPSQIRYTLDVLSRRQRTVFPDRQLIDVPLYDDAQLNAARELERDFHVHNVRGELRDSLNAIDVYDVRVVEV